VEDDDELFDELSLLVFLDELFFISDDLRVDVFVPLPVVAFVLVEDFLLEYVELLSDGAGDPLVVGLTDVPPFDPTIGRPV